MTDRSDLDSRDTFEKVLLFYVMLGSALCNFCIKVKLLRVACVPHHNCMGSNWIKRSTLMMYTFSDESHIDVALEENKELSRDFSGSVGCAA